MAESFVSTRHLTDLSVCVNGTREKKNSLANLRKKTRKNVNIKNRIHFVF